MTVIWEPVSYVDIGDLKDAINIEQDDERRDADLSGKSASASRAVDEFCDRYFGQVGSTASPVVRYFDTTGPLQIISDLVDMDTVEYRSGTTWTAIDASTLDLLPLNAAVDVPPKPYTMLRNRSGLALPAEIRITGTWGWPSIPQPVKDATLLQAVRLLKSKDVPLGVVGGADMMGTLRLSAGLHPDAMTALQPFRRVSVG